jgi:hypothetical protein
MKMLFKTIPWEDETRHKAAMEALHA